MYLLPVLLVIGLALFDWYYDNLIATGFTYIGVAAVCSLYCLGLILEKEFTKAIVIGGYGIGLGVSSFIAFWGDNAIKTGVIPRTQRAKQTAFNILPFMVIAFAVSTTLSIAEAGRLGDTTSVAIILVFALGQVFRWMKSLGVYSNSSKF